MDGTVSQGPGSGSRPLPQLSGEVFLTDSGIETDLIFHGGLELPKFAAFVLLDDASGRAALEAYFRRHADIAARYRCGIILESPTWRASRGWGARLGYDQSGLDRLNADAVALLIRLRAEYESAGAGPVVVSGCVGPRADGYTEANRMTAGEAERYHAEQIAILAAAGANLVHAMTIACPAEAAGIAAAAVAADIPAVISFTTETDGRLPDGTSLAGAIALVDAATDGAPAYYGINCAHPSHFAGALPEGVEASRLRSLRANASARSHAELDEASDIDAGDPLALAADYAGLRAQHPAFSILGGCCGTDASHVAAIAAAVLGDIG
jgi:S-methylmethionine-dependent homocysteine/selenocysteine methylase